MSSRARNATLVAALTLIGFALRLAAAWSMDFWADDLGSLGEVGRIGWANVLTPSPSEGHPPLAFLVAKAWFALAGLDGRPGEELVARLPFVILGTTAVPLAFLVARRLLAREGSALAAAAAVAVSPLLAWCDRDVRAYALLTPIALLTVLAWLAAQDQDLGPVEGQVAGRPGLGPWVLFVAAAALVLWTHYNAVPLVGALLLATALEGGRAGWKRAVLAGGAILVLFAPWLPALRMHLTAIDLSAHAAKVQLAIPPVALTAPAYVLFGLVLGYSTFPWTWAIVVPVAAAAAVLSGAAIRRARDEGCWRAPLLGLALPIVGAAATTFKMPRYYVAYVPLLAVFLLTGAEWLEGKRRRLGLALGAVVLVGMLASDVELLRGREGHFLYPLHPWRVVREHVLRNPAPIFGRQDTPFAKVYSPTPVLEPAALLEPGAPRVAYLLLDEAVAGADADALLDGARARGYRVVSDEGLLEDPDHDARESWIPRGKRAVPVRLIRLERD